MNNNSLKIQVIKIDSKDFPIKLKRLSNCPREIYVRGNMSSKQKRIAIVGTRKASPDGLKNAKHFAKKLSENKIIIVSGLALGVDASAHQGALDANGKTWAVLANGLDRIYPSSHTSLSNKILSCDGTLISEYDTNADVYPGNFIARNRIISSLSDAVIIVEAPIKSGAMSTASYAIKMNIPVFVIPGPTSSPLYEGSHKIIRNGGRLVTSWKDVMNDMKIKINKNIENKKMDSFSKTQRIIIDAIISQNGKSNIDNIIQITKLNAQDVAKTLIELQMNEVVDESYGYYILKK